jgi:beta-lactamase class A
MPDSRSLRALRPRIVPALALVPLIALGFTVAASPHAILAGASESPARAQVEQIMKASGAEIGVAFQMLDGSQELFLNADQSFHAASTMKVPVMIELFAQIHAGKIKLDDQLPIKNEFKSLMDDSAYTLDSGDDSDADVYKAIGTSWPISQLCEAMITKSSNLATNLIIEKLGVDNIRARVHLLGADGMQVLRGVEDSKAFQAGKNNTTTARGLLILLKAIEDNQAGDPDSCKQMLEILKRQTFNEAIPSGLPAGTVVAHKTGEITGAHHDAAIVFAPKPFIMVILLKGINNRDESSKVMGDITRAIYGASQ